MPSNPVAKRGSSRSLLARGVDLLSRREHSVKELREKLLMKLNEGETPEDVEAALVTLQQKGYLSDARYAEVRVRSRAGRFGNYRLLQELSQAGVDASEAREALSTLEPEEKRAQEVWERRFGRAPLDDKERAKQLRFLTSRGFSFDAAKRVVSNAENDLEPVE